MRSIAIASLFVLAGTAAQAEIVCTERGCWETGVKIILVDPSHVRGSPMTSYRNGKQQVRSLGPAEQTTPCQFCRQNKGPAPNASRAREAAAQRDGKNPNDADAALKLF
jgi:hypothetical protein